MIYLNRMGAFTLLAVACLTIMVGCVIVPGLAEISKNLRVEGAASWLVTIPSLGVVLFGPVAGKVIDKAGPYRALKWGLFLYGALGACGVFLSGMTLIMLDRLLLGGATALVMSAGTGLLSYFYTGHARLKMIASQGMSIELGGVIFLFIGGLLATLSWKWPFVLYLSAWIFLLMQVVFIPEPEKQSTDIEATGRDEPSKHISGPLMLTFYAALFSMILFFTGVIIIPQIFNAMDIGSAETGYFLSFISLVAVLAAALMPAVVAKINERNTLILAFACYATAHLLFALSGGIASMIPGAMLMGCGFGFSVPLVNHMTIEMSHERVRGRNLAYLSMAIFSGQFLSSFMEFIPGGTSFVFVGAALISVLVTLSLVVYNSSQRKVSQES